MHMPAIYFKREEIKHRDKWRAAVHEAGHATVACEKGMAWVRAWLYPNEGDWHGNFEKSWLGKMSWMRAPGDVHGGVIGVAGIVAEALYENPDVDASEIMDDWEWGNLAPSETDMASITDDESGRFDLVDEALGILRNQKRLFDAIKRLLFQDESMSDGESSDLAEELLVA